MLYFFVLNFTVQCVAQENSLRKSGRLLSSIVWWDGDCQRWLLVCALYWTLQKRFISDMVCKVDISRHNCEKIIASKIIMLTNSFNFYNISSNNLVLYRDIYPKVMIFFICINVCLIVKSQCKNTWKLNVDKR